MHIIRIDGIYVLRQHHGLYLFTVPTSGHGSLLILFLGRHMKWLIMEDYIYCRAGELSCFLFP